MESTLDEVMRAFATTQRSRIPVYRGSEDHILGFVHIKDVFGSFSIASGGLPKVSRRHLLICGGCFAKC